MREARQSVGWSLLFIFILYFTAPAYAAFAKIEVTRTSSGRTPCCRVSLPQWVYSYGKIGLVKICGVHAEGSGDPTACPAP